MYNLRKWVRGILIRVHILYICGTFGVIRLVYGYSILRLLSSIMFMNWGLGSTHLLQGSTPGYLNDNIRATPQNGSCQYWAGTCFVLS